MAPAPGTPPLPANGGVLVDASAISSMKRALKLLVAKTGELEQTMIKQNKAVVQKLRIIEGRVATLEAMVAEQGGC
jgi:uncharacterized coiled-coil protein SlyX